MNPQIIRDSEGKSTGVFITMKEWNLLESIYPEINNLGNDLPEWQKDIIDKRLDAIEKNPQRLKPMENLFEILHKDL
jgi:hypothetical protein